MQTFGSFIRLAIFFGLGLILVWVGTTYMVLTIPKQYTHMDPTIRPEHWVIFKRGSQGLDRGMIVFYHNDGKSHFGRVIALGGETLSMDENGPKVDGELLDEPYTDKSSAGDRLARTVIPLGTVYVLNDRRAAGASAFFDSRLLGPIPVGSIRGIAWGD